MMDKRKYIYKALIAVVLLTIPLFVSSRYAQHIMNMVIIYSILGISVNIIFGYIGALSLGHAAFYGIGAYIAAIASTQFELPFLLSVICAALSGCIIGILIGIPTLRLKGPYFAIATIGLNNIICIILLNWESVTGGSMGISGIPCPSILGQQFDTEIKFYYLLLVSALLIFVVYRNIVSFNFGRVLIAIRDNELAANAMGINVSKFKIIALAISTTIASIAGAYYASMISYVSPDAFPVMESITILIVVVLGGAGFKYGPFYGSVAVVIMNEYLQIFEKYNMLIYGLMIMILLLFLPSGIAGLIEIAKSKYYESRNIYYLKEVGIDEMK